MQLASISWADSSYPNIHRCSKYVSTCLDKRITIYDRKKEAKWDDSVTILNTQIQAAIDPRRQGSLREPKHFQAGFWSVKPSLRMAVSRIRICSLPYCCCMYMVFNIDHALQKQIVSSNITDVTFCRWPEAARASSHHHLLRAMQRHCRDSIFHSPSSSWLKASAKLQQLCCSRSYSWASQKGFMAWQKTRTDTTRSLMFSNGFHAETSRRHL